MRLWSWIVAGSLLAPAARAGELRPEQVPAGARWLAHLDVEALAGSRVARAARKRHAGDLELRLPGFAGADLDPLEDLRSLTAWSAGERPEQAVVLAVVSPRLDAWLEGLAGRAGARREQLAAGHEVLALSDGSRGWLAHRFEPPGERAWLVSDDRDALAEALEVLHGDGPDLASAAAPPLRARPQQGAFAFAAVAPQPEALRGMGASSGVAQLARGLLLEAGERDGAFWARLELETGSADDALRAQQIAQGALAMASLAADEPACAQALQRLLGKVRTRVAGAQVKASFECEVDALLRDLEVLEGR